MNTDLDIIIFTHSDVMSQKNRIMMIESFISYLENPNPPNPSIIKKNNLIRQIEI